LSQWHKCGFSNFRGLRGTGADLDDVLMVRHLRKKGKGGWGKVLKTGGSNICRIQLIVSVFLYQFVSIHVFFVYP
jgi:hypothetical protein